MRNIALYPLTDEEIIQHCEKELSKFLGANAPIGGMQAMIYRAIIERIKDHPRQPLDILNQGRVLTTTTSTTTARD